jgi:hypothetical protein
MENLVYILKLFKKYNWFYFIKISLCKNIFRNLLGVGACLLLILSMLAAFYGPLIYSLLLFISFGLLSIIIFKLIDKDHESTIKQPLTMEFRKRLKNKCSIRKNVYCALAVRFGTLNFAALNLLIKNTCF